MAHTNSARKRIRQTTKRAHRNRAQRSRMNTFVKKVEAAIEAGDKDAANAALHDAQSVVFRNVAKGIVKKNTARRKISRLNARIKSLSA